MLINIQSNSDAIRRYLGQSKYSLICKHEKGLSDLNHIKGTENISQKGLNLFIKRTYYKVSTILFSTQACETRVETESALLIRMTK